MKANIEDVRDGKKFTGAYLKIFQKKFMSEKEHKTSKQHKREIDKLMSEIDTVCERLETDGEHQPLRLLGLKATYSLMYQIYTGLLTVAYAIIQKLVSSGSSDSDT